MEVLKQLIEQRDQAFEAYEQFIQPLLAENRALSSEEETKRAELRSAVDRLDTRLDEVKADEDRKAKLSEARKAAGLTGVDASVVKEARTYEPGNGNSFFADLIHYSIPALPGHAEAAQRLGQHGYEQAVEVKNASDEGKAVLRQLRDNEHYRQSEDRSRKLVDQWRDRGNAGSLTGQEFRAGTTSTIAGFTTPVYLVEDWAPFRQPGRAVADSVHREELPSYGMTVYIPHFTAASAVGTQGGENTAVTETDPTSAYVSGSLATLAGQVTVSLQLLERAQLPNMDAAIFDSLQRAYAPQVDTLVINQMLAGAGTTAYTAGSFALTTTSGAGGFLLAVNGAKAQIKTAAGTYMVPNVMAVTPNRFEFIASVADAQGRPLALPNELNPRNAVAAGDELQTYEGPTGFRMSSLTVIEDNNIPTPGTGSDQAVVYNNQETWLFEGALTPRVLPQTLAQDLSVILQVYSYVTAIVRYPLSVNAISGTGMAPITW